MRHAPRAPSNTGVQSAKISPKMVANFLPSLIDCQSTSGSGGGPELPLRIYTETATITPTPNTPATEAERQYCPALCANSRTISGSSGGSGFVVIGAYLLAPQWQPRSPEQQFPGS